MINNSAQLKRRNSQFDKYKDNSINFINSGVYTLIIYIIIDRSVGTINSVIYYRFFVVIARKFAFI